MRIDKFLSINLNVKRSKASDFLKNHEVIVNNELVKKQSYSFDEYESVYIDGECYKYQKDIYIMLNKPKGYITSTKDDNPLYPIVMDLIKDYKGYNLFPVGRLDVDTTGLLLITSNGLIAHNALSPRHHVEKTYEVKTNITLSTEDLDLMEKGIVIDDKITLPSSIKYDNGYYYLTIKEGRFHQVKKMFKYFHAEVITLNRISFGPLFLDSSLKEGEYRLLTSEEIESLKLIK